MTDIITSPGIEGRILTIRGRNVMLAADLADLYGVLTKVLNQAIKRNRDRFPDAFMFQLTLEEAISSRSQIVTLNKQAPRADSARGSNIKYLPFAFTEHGVLMAANVLKSERAVKVSVRIIEAFVSLRSALLTAPDLAKKIADIEGKLTGLQDRMDIFDGIILPLLTVHQLTGPKKIGFDPEGKK